MDSPLIDWDRVKFDFIQTANPDYSQDANSAHWKASPADPSFMAAVVIELNTDCMSTGPRRPGCAG
ncbi:MAG: hypothetical protein HKN43_05270 [Rhodothermales bacterium]|nr:hypothetical protein [Rhodothermales bacterium]